MVTITINSNNWAEANEISDVLTLSNPDAKIIFGVKDSVTRTYLEVNGVSFLGREKIRQALKENKISILIRYN